MLNNPHDILTDKLQFDVLQESYNATVDIGEPNDMGTMLALSFLETRGFEFIHEESTIYTVRYTGWDE